MEREPEARQRSQGEPMRIAVIGGSTAGLATALRLQQSGHDVSVWERRSGAPSGGFGLLLTPSVHHILERLGVDLSARIHPIEQYEMLDEHGSSVMSRPLRQTSGVRRTDLVEGLGSSLAPGTLHCGTTFVGFERDERGIARAAHFSDGTSIEADLFVAADGVRSRIRRNYIGGAALSPVRTVELVGICHGDQIPETLRGRFLKAVRPGQGMAIGLVPASDNSVVWYVQLDPRRWPQAFLTPEKRHRWLIDELGDWTPAIQDVIARSEARQVHLWRTTDREIPDTFHRNNILLIGDAAHPLLTFTSQGTGSAIEDALAIGDILDDHDLADEAQLEHALGGFARLRRPVLQERLQMGRRLQHQFLHASRRCRHEVPIGS